MYEEALNVCEESGVRDGIETILLEQATDKELKMSKEEAERVAEEGMRGEKVAVKKIDALLLEEVNK